VADVNKLIRDEEKSVAATRAVLGRPVMRRKDIQRVDPFEAPNSRRPKYKLNPRLAAGGDRGALQQGIAALRHFRESYRRAWQRFCEGVRAVFPAGTYLMRRLYRVRCARLDTPWCCRAVAPG
jgi:hypothetical protein